MSMEGATGAFYDPEIDGIQISGGASGELINPVFAEWDAADAAELEAAAQWSGAVPEEEIEEATVAETNTVPPSDEVTAWERDRAKAVRDAGVRGTWHGRRGIPDQHGHYEPESDNTTVPDTKGRYVGPARISQRAIRAIAAAEGDDVAAIIP